MLNQLIRNMKPSGEVWAVFSAALCSFAISLVYQIVTVMNSVNTIDLTWWKILLIVTVVSGMVIAILAFIVLKIFDPFWKNNIRANFYDDYKEIIDEMIKEEKR